MCYRTSNLETALHKAEQMKASGKASWFRGQTRTWPMLSSLARKDPSEHKEAKNCIYSFHNWMQSVPALARLAEDEDSVLAIAQHYGFATNLIDFTTEPKVAAFFASHAPPPPLSDGEDVSCIICLNYSKLRNAYETVKTVRPNMPEPKAITLSIPDLWRIQSQHSVFLEYPYDIGFECHFYECDRIVFPTEKNPAVLAKLIPIQDIYPTQKSDLEILLDQYFMIKHANKTTNILRDIFENSGSTIDLRGL